jgi:hypothetical protein
MEPADYRSDSIHESIVLGSHNLRHLRTGPGGGRRLHNLGIHLLSLATGAAIADLVEKEQLQDPASLSSTTIGEGSSSSTSMISTR